MADILLNKAREMLAFSYAPYSQFAVGAALEAEDGRIFTGCNVENAAYGSCLCAERGAIMKAVSEGARRFRRLAIVGSGTALCFPCGACRQMLCEFAQDLPIVVGSAEGETVMETNLLKLLPHSFGAAQLDAAKDEARF